MKESVYLVLPAMFAPVMLSALAIVVGTTVSWWFLASLPFIWLGAICSAPNLNLANGCLAYSAIILGFVIVLLFKPLGYAIIAGTACGFYVSALEKWIRMRPAPNEEEGALIEAQEVSKIEGIERKDEWTEPKRY